MKKTVLLVTSLFLMAVASFTVYAGAWEQKAGGWKWNNGDSTYPVNCWKWIDSNNDGISECYYFDGNGNLLQSATAPDGYQVNADGAWIVDGAVQTKKAAETIRADVFFNTSNGNTTSSMQSLSRNSGIFAHVVLHAPRWSSLKLKYEVTWPDGQKNTGSWDDKIAEGDLASISFWYDDPQYGATGTLTLAVYTESGEKIGEGSVQITD